MLVFITIIIFTILLFIFLERREKIDMRHIYKIEEEEKITKLQKVARK